MPTRKRPRTPGVLNMCKYSALTLIAVFLILVTYGIARAQTVAPATLAYTFGTAATGTSTGQLSKYLVLDGIKAPRPETYSIDWTVAGTAPSACTFRTEWSSDGTNWQGADATSPAANSCTASGGESITTRPALLVRINLATFTAGDATTKVTFHYTGGR